MYGFLKNVSRILLGAEMLFCVCAGEVKTLQTLNEQQKAMITLIQSNFTHTVQYLNQERDITIRERDKHHQDAILLRRENTMLKEQHVTYTKYCCLSI